MPDFESATGSILINLVDGARRALPDMVRWDSTITDRQPPPARKSHEFKAQTGSHELITDLPFFNNFFDDYTVFVRSEDYEDTGWYPVRITSTRPVSVDLMLLHKNGHIVFGAEQLQQLIKTRASVFQLLNNGSESDALTRARVFKVLESHPFALAALLNIATALAEMRLPSGKSPLDYYWQLSWPPGDPDKSADWSSSLGDTFKQDRFFAYVDETLIKDIRVAEEQGAFAEEKNPAAFHGGDATESYKQARFEVANVQLTFHGPDACFLNGIKCVKVEPDMDYYKDLLTHGLLEVLPNWFTHGKTDPRFAYMLRWMAGSAAGRAFNPIYTVDA
jgi:hypothetical protein